LTLTVWRYRQQRRHHHRVYHQREHWRVCR
jgi:hypothetical protein